MHASDSTDTRSELYRWRNVVIGGGGFVTGIITHPQAPGLIYARTDVGGAYRWDDREQRWIALTDWIGRQDGNLMGIESLAVDPSDSNVLYLAAGTYTSGKAAILRSHDRGQTFERTDVPFRMGANEIGRANGERLAVDPHDGRILYFGSRLDGLWKSVDRGVTWTLIESFPEPSGTPDSRARAEAGTGFGSRSRNGFNRQEAGIVCVSFDPAGGAPGAATPIIYVAVSTIETNLFRSTNGGLAWHAVSGQPIGLRPNHVIEASDGILYLSYGREPGPNTMTDGAVWKFAPRTGAWTDITPLRSPDGDQSFGYGAVAVDARNPSTVMVTTFCRWKPHDEVFRSTNGGASWTALLQRAEWDYTSAPYTQARTPHWMGDIEIDPFDANRVMFTTGYGIWSCSHVADADKGRPTHWNFFSRGLEETVPLALISPPQGAHLISGVGDIDGFRHDDLDGSPARGGFADPRFSNTEGLAFAWENPLIIARVGVGGKPGSVHAAISFDGGIGWESLGSEASGMNAGGGIALSADGRTLVWTPRRSSPHRSTDRGVHWTACAGLAPGTDVIADTVSAAKFYAYDSRTATVFVSTNGAESFAATIRFPPPDSTRSTGGRLNAVPGTENDLWLASGSGGLMHSTDGGATFARVAQVAQAYSLGFGKAARAQTYPALYLAGTVGEVPGLFRSEDAGQSWVRINDARHQFGWIDHVTGDPRVYGRVYLATGGRGILCGEPAGGRLDL